MQWLNQRLARITRDGVLFTAGLLGVMNEAVIRDGGERPTLLVLFAAMMGLPVFLRQDEKHQDDDKKTPPDGGR